MSISQAEVVSLFNRTKITKTLMVHKRLIILLHFFWSTNSWFLIPHEDLLKVEGVNFSYTVTLITAEFVPSKGN